MPCAPDEAEIASRLERRLGAAQPVCVHCDEHIGWSSRWLADRNPGTLLVHQARPEVRMSWEESGTELKVLVVDDHDLFRTGLRTLLAESGFDTAEAASGEAALRRVQELRPDVIVMDLNMPGMSG